MRANESKHEEDQLQKPMLFFTGANNNPLSKDINALDIEPHERLREGNLILFSHRVSRISVAGCVPESHIIVSQEIGSRTITHYRDLV